MLRSERTFWEKITLLQAVFHSGRCRLAAPLRPGSFVSARIRPACDERFGLLASVVEHRKSSSGKLRRDTILLSLEAFGYAVRKPISLEFEATTGTCGRCSLRKRPYSIA